jgi:ribosome maturation factor RimP
MNKVESYIMSHYSPTLEMMGYSFYYVEYKKDRKESVLRIFAEPLDENRPMDIDACEQISRKLSDDFDHDKDFPINEAYMLEVSSPGLERELYIPEHYQKQIGKKIRLKFFKEKFGDKELVAVLKDVYEDGILVEVAGQDEKLLYKEFAKAQSYCEF